MELLFFPTLEWWHCWPLTFTPPEAPFFFLFLLIEAPDCALLDSMDNLCRSFATFRCTVLLRMPKRFWRVTTIADLWPNGCPPQLLEVLRSNIATIGRSGMCVCVPGWCAGSPCG